MPPQINLTAVLYLRPMTRSIFMRPYLATVDSKPLLAMLAERVLTRCGARRFLIVYHYESERDALEAAVEGTGTELRHTAHFDEVQAVGEILPEIDEDQIAILQLGSALAPADLLLRMSAHHARYLNSFTVVEGLPADCLISVYAKATLVHLAQMTKRTEFSNTEVAVRSLALFGERNQTKAPFSLHAKNFDFFQAYGIGAESIPQGLFMREKLEFALLDQAVAKVREDGADPDSPAILRELKQLQIRRTSSFSRIPPEDTIKLPRLNPGKIRVLYMSPPSAFSGAEQALCSMVKFLDHQRFEPLAVVDHDGVFAEKLRSLGVEVLCPDREVLLQDVERFAYMLSLYRQLRPDVVHLNGRGTLPMVATALLYGIPIVQHIRNGDLRGFEDGLSAASSIVAISEFLKRETLKYPVRGDRVKIVYDEVDTEFYNPDLFSKAECRRTFDLDPDAPTVLMIARVVPNKRYDLMLQAAAQIRLKVPGLKLVLKGDVYGDSPYHRKIQGLIETLRLEDCVRWFDFVPDIRTLIAAADVLVLCSDREGLGSCVVEAMSMALPVVVTDTGGTHEIVESGVSGGFVIRGGDYGFLTSRVVELLNDEELRTRLGRAGREYVRNKLDARISCRTMMDLYESLVKDKEQSAPTPSAQGTSALEPSGQAEKAAAQT